MQNYQQISKFHATIVAINNIKVHSPHPDPNNLTDYILLSLADHAELADYFFKKTDFLINQIFIICYNNSRKIILIILI